MRRDVVIWELFNWFILSILALALGGIERFALATRS